MKNRHQIVWHLFPTAAVFATLLGVQVLFATVAFSFLALFGTGEWGSLPAWEVVLTVLHVVSAAFIPSMVLFLTVPILDKSIRKRPLWLKIVLSFLFVVAAPLLVYVWLQIPSSGIQPPWWPADWPSPIDELVSILGLSTIAFAPYWCILQIQRVVLWSLKKAMSSINRSVVWHSFRYVVATCVSTVTLALIPLLVTLAWVLAVAVDSLLHFVGEGWLDGGIVYNLIVMVFMALMFAGVGAFAAFAVLSLVIAFSILIVLPVSLTAELIFRRLAIRRIIPRLGGFLLVGFLAEIAIATIVAILLSSLQLEIPIGGLLGPGVVILLVYVCIVFVFGFALTMLSSLKDQILRLKEKFEQRKLPAIIY